MSRTVPGWRCRSGRAGERSLSTSYTSPQATNKPLIVFPIHTDRLPKWLHPLPLARTQLHLLRNTDYLYNFPVPRQRVCFPVCAGDSCDRLGGGSGSTAWPDGQECKLAEEGKLLILPPLHQGLLKSPVVCFIYLL